MDIESIGITIYDSKEKECAILKPVQDPYFEDKQEMKRFGDFYDYFHDKQTEEE